MCYTCGGSWRYLTTRYGMKWKMENLQRFYSLFTQMLHIGSILKFRVYRIRVKNPIKANSEWSEDIPNFWDPDRGVGAKPRVLLRQPGRRTRNINNKIAGLPEIEKSLTTRLFCRGDIQMRMKAMKFCRHGFNRATSGVLAKGREDWPVTLQGDERQYRSNWHSEECPTNGDIERWTD